METQDSIYFYGHDNLYGWMSNFYPTNFVDLEGNQYHCSEQYLMYMKAKTFEPNNNLLLNTILNETNQKKIKELGRSVKKYDDNIWNNIRYDIMKTGLRFKFSQNLHLKKMLIGTGIKTLYEASPYDKIWGIGFNTTNAPNINKCLYGRNLLGNALMDIRDEYR